LRLSIILIGRNDSYGGDFVGRLNRSLESIMPLGAEVIFVEWNPLGDRPRINTEIRHQGVRVITVYPEVHRSLPGHELFPVFEYRAKNVGIRRATGDWILCLNSDIILGVDMQKRLSGPREVSSPCLYTASRHDMHDDKLLQICDGPGDFALMYRDRWMELRGYLDLVSYTHIDSLLLWNASHAGIKNVKLPHPIFHQEHDRSEHKLRTGIHSSDMPKFIGMKNDENWGLAQHQLPEVTT
jgi:hypothetical protein